MAGSTYLLDKLLKNSAAPIIIIGDSIAIGLRRYKGVWRNYFNDTLNLGISSDCDENLLWRTRDISLSHTSLAIIQCDTNNVNQSLPKDIEKAFTKKHPKINTIITSMFSRSKKTCSIWQTKIDEKGR